MGCAVIVNAAQRVKDKRLALCEPPSFPRIVPAVPIPQVIVIVCVVVLEIAS